jgi:hypothetical protein
MNINYAKGTPVTVMYGDNLKVDGTFVSVNSKGVNIKTADGKIKAMALSRVVAVVDNTPDTDGLTTREVAALFDMEAKVLRVHLRAMGAGVGKGRRYGFTSEDVEAIRTHLTNA